jgi:hypothetical protein
MSVRKYPESVCEPRGLTRFTEVPDGDGEEPRAVRDRRKLGSPNGMIDETRSGRVCPQATGSSGPVRRLSP